jgi:thioredoxin-like negative regulator of GroEL
MPILLDCYADWCAPCKKLEPLLKDIVQSFEGKVRMVKLNIDNLP